MMEEASNNRDLRRRVSSGTLFLALMSCFAWTGLALHASTAPSSAAALSFSPKGGAFATNVALELSTDVSQAVIRYTLDGSDPEDGSAVYAAPVALTNSVIVRARVFPSGLPPGPVLAEAYTLMDDEVAEFTSNLPLIIVQSHGTNFARDHKVEGSLQIFDAKPARARLGARPEFSGPALINVRGRASLRYPKSSFTVKLVDGMGDPESASLLGMPAEADWVLYAPYPDKTLMRDLLAYEICNEMGHWAPRTRLAEVFVNQTGSKLSRRDYVGVYVFEERIKRDRQRVDIARLKPDDIAEPRITGGYIFKKDHVGFGGGGPGGGDLGGFVGAPGPSMSTRYGYPTGPGGFPADPKGFQPPYRGSSRSSSSSSSSSSRSSRSSRIVTNYLGRPAPLATSERDMVYRDDDEDPYLPDEESFKTSRTNEIYFVEPEPDEITAVQKAWLKNHLNQFEAALYGPGFRDPDQGYARFIDPDSFVDYHLVVETTKNVDGFRFSVFFHKDRGGRIKAMPIWDWNLSFGNANGKQGWIPEFWLWPQLDDKEYSWYRRLFEDPDFGQRYVDRWTQLRTNVLATDRLLARIDAIAALLEEAQRRNFEKWPILGRPVNPNYFVGSSYDEEVVWMKKYLQTRLDWMERQFPPVPTLTGNAPAGPASLTANHGEIYFTLDGTDPRAAGGQVAAGARRYEQPFQAGPGARLFARVRQENRWSGPRVFSVQ